jgi:transcriptional regulator with GAF, ATPase, and Fis domain
VDPSWISGEGGQARSESQPRTGSAAQEKETIEVVLAKTRGKVSGPAGAATALGIPPSTLESKIRSLKINKFRFRNG